MVTINKQDPRYSVVFEAVRDRQGTIVDWRYLDSTAETAGLVGHSRDTLIGRLLSEVAPDRAQLLIPLYRKLLESRSPAGYQIEVESRTYAVNVLPAGEHTIVSTALSLTASEAARQQARDDRAAREWLTSVLDSMSEEVYFTDTQRRYTYANPAALRAFGHASVAGRPLVEIVARLEVLRPDGSVRPIEEAPPLRALAGENVRDEEQVVRIPTTGELRHRQVTSTPVRDATGSIIGSVSVVRDVTDIRRMNEELRMADRRKDEFIAMLAHELRNPLVPIRAGVELLKRATGDAGIVEQIRPMMQRQVMQMTRLIDDLLDVSRITSGKIELQRQWVTMTELVDRAIEANRGAILDSGLVVELDLAKPDPALHLDPARFTQVISNLVQNSTKFTPRGGRLAISSRLERPSASGPAMVELCVSDSGAGITADLLPHVFDLFVQSETTNTRDRSGLGIGLALARRLVELHGGTIAVASEGAGRGCRFTIRLEAPVRSWSDEPDEAIRPDSLAGLTVLVVDDNRDAADALAMLVGMSGADVRVAYGGAAALAALQQRRADVVLLDIGMAGMDGHETCRRMRAAYGTSIGLVAFSGWGQDKDRRLALEAGFDAHLAKPATPAVIERAIRSLACRKVPAD